MSVLFNGTNSFIQHGSGASLDSLDSVTVIWWDYPNTVAAGNGRIAVKLNPGVAGWQIWSSVINAGSARLFHIRGTTSSDVRMATNTRQVSSWNFNAITDSDGVAPKTYWGSLTANVADVTNTGTTVTGSGAEADHSAQSLGVGGETSQTSLNGRIAMLWIYNRVLTLGEIQLHQWLPSTILSGCVLKVNYLSVSTLQDLSGNANNGTATNSPTTAVHVPLGPPFARALGWEGAFTAAAVSGRISKLAGAGGGLVGPSRGLVAAPTFRETLAYSRKVA